MQDTLFLPRLCIHKCVETHCQTAISDPETNLEMLSLSLLLHLLNLLQPSPTFSNHLKPSPTLSNLLQPSPNFCKVLQTFQPPPTSSNLLKPSPTSSKLLQPFQPSPTSSKLFQPPPILSNLLKLSPTSSNLLQSPQPPPTSSNLLNLLKPSSSTSIFHLFFHHLQPTPMFSNLLSNTDTNRHKQTQTQGVIPTTMSRMKE